MSDLLTLAKSGNSDAQDELLATHKHMVKKIARTFFIMGADSEDIVQEGMIGLFNAIVSYDTRKDASFETYANLCITRQILNALKTASRKKHAPLNFYISLDLDDSNNELNLVDKNSPENLFISKEDGQNIVVAIYDVLSAFESSVLSLYLEGMNHVEIAKRLDKSEKSIDNAIQRIRNKTRSLLGDKRM